MVTASKRLMKALSLGDPVCRLDAAKTWAGGLERRQGNHPVESLNRLHLPFARLRHRGAFQPKKSAFLGRKSARRLREPVRITIPGQTCPTTRYPASWTRAWSVGAIKRPIESTACTILRVSGNRSGQSQNLTQPF